MLSAAPRRVVVDTNVFVSGLLRRGTPPAHVLDLIIGGAVHLVVADAIVNEYRDVLRRPRFGFDPIDVERFLSDTVLASEYVTEGTLDVELPDPDDLPFLRVAVTGQVDALVTGNKKHFVPTRGTHHIRILSPREFTDSL